MSPYRRYCGQHTILAGRGLSFSDAVSPSSSTTSSRGRHECPFGSKHSAFLSPFPPPVLTGIGCLLKTTSDSPCSELVVPTKTTTPSTLDHRVAAASAMTAGGSGYCLVSTRIWETPQKNVSHFSAIWRNAHIFCLKVDVDHEVGSRPVRWCLQHSPQPRKSLSMPTSCSMDLGTLRRL